MATYAAFEELPVWQAAIRLGVRIFKLIEHPSLKFEGVLVNPVSRAALLTGKRPSCRRDHLRV